MLYKFIFVLIFQMPNRKQPLLLQWYGFIHPTLQSLHQDSSLVGSHLVALMHLNLVVSLLYEIVVLPI